MLHEPPVGTLAALVCPECGGPLWEIHDGELLRYRCRSGHAYSGESAYAAKSEALDDALWEAYNALRESAIMARRLAAEARERGHTTVAKRFEARAQAQLRRSEAILTVVAENSGAVPLDRLASEQHLPAAEREQIGKAGSAAGRGPEPARDEEPAREPEPDRQHEHEPERDETPRAKLPSPGG